MKAHQHLSHLSDEEILEQVRRADAELVTTSEWDDLILRRRIRAALAEEKPHARSVFGRLMIFRPAWVSALAAVIALAVWTPLAATFRTGVPVASLSVESQARVPAWSPLPEVGDDEGLAVLEEWTPNEDEMAIAGCRAACLAGLSSHEEESLMSAVAQSAVRSPRPEVSPL